MRPARRFPCLCVLVQGIRSPVESPPFHPVAEVTGKCGAVLFVFRVGGAIFATAADSSAESSQLAVFDFVDLFLGRRPLA